MQNCKSCKTLSREAEWYVKVTGKNCHASRLRWVRFWIHTKVIQVGRLIVQE